tara:strand:- start:677 stop:859 length:183 start_codon:yes stop_codon:yes gene_type:complete
MLERQMKIELNTISENLIEVAVINNTGGTVATEKHRDIQSANMAAKFLSVKYNCPIINNE